MTEDDLKMQFELVRQSIGTWSADAVHFVGAGSESRQVGTHDADQIAAATRTLDAIRSERTSLAEATALVPTKSDDLARGIDIALNELDLLERDISAALAEMR
ncbi:MULTISPECIES: hypothetical protein [unclassified Devosia]|uniref:hypothetical protein n=1 Tax=unclassified Devosia TaxID=196773 RepID=UPI000FDCDA86|nr:MULTISPECIES: hypothetical protein [unclassified Devosia]